MEGLIDALRRTADYLSEMKDDGVTIAGGTSDDDVYTLVTDNPQVAAKYNMQAMEQSYNNGDSNDDIDL